MIDMGRVKYNPDMNEKSEDIPNTVGLNEDKVFYVNPTDNKRHNIINITPENADKFIEGLYVIDGRVTDEITREQTYLIIKSEYSLSGIQIEQTTATESMYKKDAHNGDLLYVINVAGNGVIDVQDMQGRKPGRGDPVTKLSTDDATFILTEYGIGIINGELKIQ